jgi:catechol 2,3-dioxygenase-like lactoylglutathione lyase family enzyme
MANESAFLHTGVTVSNIEKSIDFYRRYFGFTLDKQITFSPEFIAAKPALYKQNAGVYSKMAMISAPNGIKLELFEWSNVEKGKEAVWNNTGYHHIALKVPSVAEYYERMKAEDVEFYFPPSPMMNTDSHWIFLKDPDGNMIELQD